MDFGPVSDETLIIELLLGIDERTRTILAILEEDDEEEDPEDDA